MNFIGVLVVFNRVDTTTYITREGIMERFLEDISHAVQGILEANDYADSIAGGYVAGNGGVLLSLSGTAFIDNRTAVAISNVLGCPVVATVGVIMLDNPKAVPAIIEGEYVISPAVCDTVDILRLIAEFEQSAVCEE